MKNLTDGQIVERSDFSQMMDLAAKDELLYSVRFDAQHYVVLKQDDTSYQIVIFEPLADSDAFYVNRFITLTSLRDAMKVLNEQVFIDFEDMIDEQ